MIRKAALLIAALCAHMFSLSAFAATAEFIAPSTAANSDIAALSNATDGSGLLIGMNQTLALRFDTPFATESPGVLTVSTIAPDSGLARATFRVGSYNNGNPVFVAERNVRAGLTHNLNNLFNRGCSVFGGCDYVEITTFRTRDGATGVEVDYVLVDGEIVEVTSPTPEPATWALMILGFASVGARIKQVRRERRRSTHSQLAFDAGALQLG